MAAAGYLDYDPATGRYALPADHVPVLAEEAGPFFFGSAFFEYLAAPLLGAIQVVHAFARVDEVTAGPGDRPEMLELVSQHLFQLTVVMAEAMEEDLSNRGLTRARATLLAYLHDQGPTIQRVLAGALRVSPRNMTGLVNGLQASGLVKRLPHPTDGRAALVELTDDGVRAAAALARDEREFAQYLFADRTAGELSNLTVGLEQLLARLNDSAHATLRRSSLRR